MRFGSLFSGIGGLDLGLERAGMTCAWQVEIDEWCRAVLERHWPGLARWGDVTTFLSDPASPGFIRTEQPQDHRPRGAGRGANDPDSVREGGSVDLICGGFPCQPVSHAGKRLGQDDERWLWPEFARIVRVLRPRFVLVENVPGLLSRGMGDVLGDLAASGYDTEWDCIPAAAVGAPHLRYRVFIIAQRAGAERERLEVASERDSEALEPGIEASRRDDVDGLRDAVPDAIGCGRNGRSRYFTKAPRREEPTDGDWWATEPDVGRVAHGISNRVDRLKALGNAIVPQVAEWIGRRLMEGQT